MSAASAPPRGPRAREKTASPPSTAEQRGGKPDCQLVVETGLDGPDAEPPAPRLLGMMAESRARPRLAPDASEPWCSPTGVPSLVSHEPTVERSTQVKQAQFAWHGLTGKVLSNRYLLPTRQSIRHGGLRCGGSLSDSCFSSSAWRRSDSSLLARTPTQCRAAPGSVPPPCKEVRGSDSSGCSNGPRRSRTRPSRAGQGNFTDA